jgi:hypothetical protein
VRAPDRRQILQLKVALSSAAAQERQRCSAAQRSEIMTDSTRVTCPRGRRPPPTARIAAAVVVTASIALVAGCGGSNGNHVAQLSRKATTSDSASNVSTEHASSDALAYSRCMRSNGVPKYPDPGSGNVLPDGLPKVDFHELGVSNSQFAAAERNCAHALPNSGTSTAAASQQALSDAVRFSACMRSHGVPNWPDPTTTSGGLGFNLIGIQPPVNTDSLQFQHALRDCGHLMPKSLGGIRIRQP